jgi:hypothetical protein
MTACFAVSFDDLIANLWLPARLAVGSRQGSPFTANYRIFDDFLAENIIKSDPTKTMKLS